MTVQVGDKIFAIDDNREFEVQQIVVEIDPSSSIDFLARHTTTNFVDRKGNKIYGGRGFRFQDEGTIWK